MAKYQKLPINTNPVKAITNNNNNNQPPLTRSRTSENSGELRVLRGRAGTLARSSSVRGGKLRMMEYLQGNKEEKQ